MNIRKSLLILLLLAVFVAEHSLLPFLMPDSWQLRIVPNAVLIALFFVTVYHNRHTALILGLSFGMLHDVVFYGRLLGAYSLAMGLSAYLIGIAFKMPRAPLPLMMSIVLLGSLLSDSILFGIYRVFSLTQESYRWALTHHMLPTMLFHFALGLILYIPTRNQLNKLKLEQRKEEAV